MERKDETVIDIWKILQLLLKRLWIILLVSVIGAAAAFFYTHKFITPQYRASADLYVNGSTSIAGMELSVSSGTIQTARSLIPTYSVILKSRLTLEEVINRLDLPYSYGALSGRVSAASVGETEILRITVTSSDPEEARLIANTIVDVLPEKISKIVHGSSVEVVDLAVTPGAPFSPSYSSNVTKGFIVGLVLSALAVILLEYFLHDSIEDTEWLKNEFGEKVPVLAAIPDANAKHKKGSYGKYGKYYGYYKNGYNTDKKDSKDGDKSDEKKDSNLLVNEMADFITTESYNRLRSNLEFVCPVKEDGGRVIGVTSANPHEGKSFTAINLGYTLAKSGYRVLLLDADMRLSTIAKKLGLPLSPGLSNILANQSGNVVHQLEKHPNLSVVTAGDVSPNPSELLSSAAMRRLVKFFSEKFDFVIIDLPPVNTVIDPVAISPCLDGMLLVVKHSDTKKRELLDALHQLEFARTNVLGFIYNGYCQNSGHYSRRSGKYKYYKYGGYGYGYGYKPVDGMNNVSQTGDESKNDDAGENQK